MWCIIIPVTCIPIYAGLIMARRAAVREGKLDDIKATYTRPSLRKSLIWFFWRLDVVGVILLIAMLALILIPLTVAAGVQSNWQHAYVIVMLVIGVLCIPAFVSWELKFARHPCVPFRLLNDRTILSGLIMALLLNMAWYLQGE
jgi:SIT family siderophore-iron:H+ symporter-like MFS transporter